MRETALVMLGELESERLRVSLAPSVHPEIAERGGKIRVVDSHNPQWYINLCRDWPARRTRQRRRKHFDTAIKRRHVQRALAEIADGRCQSEYAQRLLEVVAAEDERYRKEFG